MRTWILTAAVIVLLVAACAWMPHWPGDVALTRVIQSVAPGGPGWAQVVTAAAKWPWNVLLVAGTVLVSWLIRGGRLAVWSLASFPGVWALDKVSKPWIGRPRPSAELVEVVGSPSGFSFPSTFALTFAATFGFLAVAAAVYLRGRNRWLVVTAPTLILLVGGAARIVLGAHWPSDILASYLLGMFWAAVLVRLSRAGTEGAG